MGRTEDCGWILSIRKQSAQASFARGVLMSDVLLSFEDVFNIPLAVQNSNYAESVFVQEIINSDGFESRNRPGAEISELRIARTIARTHKRMLRSEEHTSELQSRPHLV